MSRSTSLTEQTMQTREWLAHAALQATLDVMNDQVNTVKFRRFQDATERLCPVCEHAIIYCKCFEQADHPDRNRKIPEGR